MVQKKKKSIDWNTRLARVARELLNTQKGASISDMLEKKCPEVHSQICEAAKHPNLLRLWGRSLNIDENAKGKIVDPRVLKTIGTLANIDMSEPAVHAGLQHTYGYLFSLLETPYGFKRERWTRSEIDEGFGFNSPTLRPNPHAGSLLANLTYFLGRIAMRGRSKEVRILREHRDFVAGNLQNFGYGKLKRRGIVETIKAKANDGKSRVVRIFTHIVTMPHCEKSLVIYWYDDALESNAKLLTAFPVDPDNLTYILVQPMGPKVAIRARYNCFIEGITAHKCVGKRKLLS